MTISMHAVSVPLFKQLLLGLSAVLEKGAAFAEARRIDPAVLLQSRLAPDMFPLIRQVQIASDTAKGAVSRLAGIEVPSWADTETTFDEARRRIATTLEYIEGIPAERINGSEDRAVVLKLRGTEVNFTGQGYLLHFAIPNFTFHVTTAYSILRHNGVEVGKRDYLGRF